MICGWVMHLFTLRFTHLCSMLYINMLSICISLLLLLIYYWALYLISPYSLHASSHALMRHRPSPGKLMYETALIVLCREPAGAALSLVHALSSYLCRELLRMRAQGTAP